MIVMSPLPLSKQDQEAGVMVKTLTPNGKWLSLLPNPFTLTPSPSLPPSLLSGNSTNKVTALTPSMTTDSHQVNSFLPTLPSLLDTLQRVQKRQNSQWYQQDAVLWIPGITRPSPLVLPLLSLSLFFSLSLPMCLLCFRSCCNRERKESLNSIHLKFRLFFILIFILTFIPFFFFLSFFLSIF